MEDSEDITDFLAKVDQIEGLVKDLVTSSDHTSTARALDRADQYINSTKDTSKQDRMLVSKSPSPHMGGEERGVVAPGGGGGAEVNQASFKRSIEEDAKERGERRREREGKAKEAKKNGNKAFKEGRYEEALRFFTDGINNTPWDLTLYTNKALTYNKMSSYTQAIEECDAALKIEPATLKAYIHKGNALRGLHREPEAKECFHKALQLFPDQAVQINSYL